MHSKLYVDNTSIHDMSHCMDYILTCHSYLQNFMSILESNVMGMIGVDVKYLKKSKDYVSYYGLSKDVI